LSKNVKNNINSHLKNKIKTNLKFRSIHISKSYVSFPEEKGEDRFQIGKNFAAVADGSGGTGIFCGEWADYLLQHITTQPIVTYEDFIAYLYPLAGSFSSEFENIVGNDAYKKNRFFLEGSSSTLAIIWWDEIVIRWITYGDSHIIFIRDENIESHPFKLSSEFSGESPLINWKTVPKEGYFMTGEINREGLKRVIIATDAVSKYVLNTFEKLNKGQSKKFIDQLYKSCGSLKTFCEIIETGRIDIDDYTILISNKLE